MSGIALIIDLRGSWPCRMERRIVILVDSTPAQLLTLENLLSDAGPPSLLDAIPEVDEPPGGVVTRIGSSTDRLVELHGALPTLPAYDGKLGPRGSLPLRLRTSVVEKLQAARWQLPSRIDLIVLDGWRSVQFQTELVEHFGPELTTGGYVSSVTNTGFVPPHCTGGAVDLTLSLDGIALKLGSDFDEFSDKAHLTYYENSLAADRRIRNLRRVLYNAMNRVGFAPYRLEWWHYSYGDQHWAAYKGLDRSIFGEYAE